MHTQLWVYRVVGETRFYVIAAESQEALHSFFDSRLQPNQTVSYGPYEGTFLLRIDIPEPSNRCIQDEDPLTVSGTRMTDQVAAKMPHYMMVEAAVNVSIGTYRTLYTQACPNTKGLTSEVTERPVRGSELRQALRADASHNLGFTYTKDQGQAETVKTIYDMIGEDLS